MDVACQYPKQHGDRILGGSEYGQCFLIRGSLLISDENDSYIHCSYSTVNLESVPSVDPPDSEDDISTSWESTITDLTEHDNPNLTGCDLTRTGVALQVFFFFSDLTVARTYCVSNNLCRCFLDLVCFSG